MKEIFLTGGHKAFVDDEDYELVTKLIWRLEHKYAVSGNNKTSKQIYMHNLVKPAPEGLINDHKDRNGLNNQKENLRHTTYCMNQHNKPINANNSSGYKGVSWHKNNQKWEVRISINKQRKCLGLFDTCEEAARVYNEAALKLHGEFAYQNLI